MQILIEAYQQSKIYLLELFNEFYRILEQLLKIHKTSRPKASTLALLWQLLKLSIDISRAADPKVTSMRPDQLPKGGIFAYIHPSAKFIYRTLSGI